VARLTPERRAELRALGEKATPGPWRMQSYVGDPGDPHEYAVIGDADNTTPMISGDGFHYDRNDAMFVCAVRDAVFALLAELEAVEAERERFRALLHDARDGLRYALDHSYIFDDEKDDLLLRRLNEELGDDDG
jgi:2-polyprenyl-6-methoxyphenol hydroxylase-like FAD-dependent oxidoreductase